MSKLQFNKTKNVISRNFCFGQNKSETFLNPRLIFQGGAENSPKAPESFTGKEKQSDQDAINEVAQQSPSQIMSSAVTRASTTQTRFTQSSKILASLITNDPLLNPNLDQNSPPPGTQTANDNTRPNNQAAA